VLASRCDAIIGDIPRINDLGRFLTMRDEYKRVKEGIETVGLERVSLIFLRQMCYRGSKYFKPKRTLM
jgi:hypothetical protein